MGLDKKDLAMGAASIGMIAGGKVISKASGDRGPISGVGAMASGAGVIGLGYVGKAAFMQDVALAHKIHLTQSAKSAARNVFESMKPLGFKRTAQSALKDANIAKAIVRSGIPGRIF